MGFRNRIQKRKDARRKYQKHQGQGAEKRDAPPPVPSVTIVITRPSQEQPMQQQSEPKKVHSFSSPPAEATPSSLRPSSTSSIASSSTMSSKKKVRFCIENVVSVHPKEDTSVEEILRQLDEMLISDKRARKRRKGNDSVAVEVKDDTIEVEITSPTTKEENRVDVTDGSVTLDQGCHGVDNFINTGCINLSADILRQRGTQLDDLLHSTIQNSQKVWRELRQAKRKYSSDEVMSRVMNYLDQKSHLLEETRVAMDETARWFRGGENVMSGLQKSTQSFSDAIMLSMGCQTESDMRRHRRSKGDDSSDDLYLYPRSE